MPVDDDVATVLAGWGPDRTYWLTDVVLDVPSREVWNLDREMWARRAD